MNETAPREVIVGEGQLRGIRLDDGHVRSRPSARRASRRASGRSRRQVSFAVMSLRMSVVRPGPGPTSSTWSPRSTPFGRAGDDPLLHGFRPLVAVAEHQVRFVHDGLRGGHCTTSVGDGEGGASNSASFPVQLRPAFGRRGVRPDCGGNYRTHPDSACHSSPPAPTYSVARRATCGAAGSACGAPPSTLMRRQPLAATTGGTSSCRRAAPCSPGRAPSGRSSRRGGRRRRGRSPSAAGRPCRPARTRRTP